MIVKATYLKDYQLRVYFDDGFIREIDLYPFMSSSNHPLIKKFLNKKLFKKFVVDDWGLRWGDNEFDINPVNIYEGKFDIGKKDN
jgi:hypothetical protein